MAPVENAFIVALGFKSFANGTGHGYNVFLDHKSYKHRVFQFSCSYGPSHYDGKESMHLWYGDSHFPFNFMHDEIRYVFPLSAGQRVIRTPSSSQ